MIQQSTNLSDFLMLGPCCGVLLLVLLVVGGVFLMLKQMGPPHQPKS